MNSHTSLSSYVRASIILIMVMCPVTGPVWLRGWVQVQLYSDMTAALEEGEWSASRPGRTSPPGKTRYPFLQEAGWAPGAVWTGGKSRPYRDSIPDRPARSQSLYRLSYPAHKHHIKIPKYWELWNTVDNSSIVSFICLFNVQSQLKLASYINLLAPELFSLILAHHVQKCE